MTAPVIPALPTPPVRSDAPADFAAKADAFAASLVGFVNDVNGSAVFIDQRATDADARATASANSASAAAQAKTDAELARDAAQNVANFKGAWSSLTGSLSLPATVLHNGMIWSLLVNLPDVTLSQPGVTADWIVQGGLDASKTASFTASRNSRYWLPSTVTVTLPAVAGMPVGTFVELSKAQAATPIIQATDGTQILVNGQADTSVTYNLNARLLVVFNGTAWEI